MRTAVRNVKELPPATTFLNYPKQGPEIGTYLGPNLDGEYFTVVSREPVTEAVHSVNAIGPVAYVRVGGVRVGLAYGCLTIKHKPTDPRGLPPEVEEVHNITSLMPFRNPAATDVRPLVAMKEAVRRAQR